MSLQTPPTDWLLGVDVSVSQGVIKPQPLIDAGASFLYARATDGEHDVDRQWLATAEACHAAGLPFGAYGVLEPYGPARARTQAEHFAELVQHSEAQLPPWLDFELAKGLSGHDALEAAAIWCDEVEALLGQRVMVYTGPAFVATLARFAGASGDDSLARLANRPIVVAHYTGSFWSKPSVPHPWVDWTMWQASGDARVSSNHSTLPGTSIVVDVDLFRGTPDELLALGEL